MLISLNELKKYVNLKVETSELLGLIGSRLVEIESVEDLSEKYRNIFIVRVEECEKIPETHLSLCKINVGKPELVQVVCGAPNVRKGMSAVWIAPGAIVPSTFGEENFKIETRKLRGFESNGMLASADELALGDDHSGIVEIDPNFAQPGDSFAEKFELNDLIIEVENKSLTHRPDCFGLVGFARELAGILGEKFVEPEMKKNLLNLLKDHAPTDENFLRLPIDVKNPQLCPRYEALVFEFKNLPEKSPYLSLDDVFLFKSGMRPVSPIVDLTNIIMLKTGQPLHAFDYDKFVSVGQKEDPNVELPAVGVRLAKSGEKLTLLDDKEIDLNENDIIITSHNVPVALAGAMGGKSTEIDEKTKKIILEIASFSLYNLRKTQMSHGIFSEAITRFTKGRPAADVLPALLSSLDLFQDKFDAKLIGVGHGNPDESALEKRVVKITPKEINSLLGSNYSLEKIIKTLENVGFVVRILSADESSAKILEITAPNWRTDIKIKEDIIEEVGRLLGFDNLPLSFPTRSFSGVKIDPILKLKSTLRNLLSNRFGGNEVLSYSFVSSALLEKANEDPEDSYKLVNSLSPELQRFRTSLVPSLLEKFYDNKKAGFKDFSLYEINQISKKSFGLNDENVPKMKTELAFLTSGDFYKVKSLLLELLREFNLAPSLKPLKSASFLEPLHSAAFEFDGKPFATFGEIKTSVLKRFKLEPKVSVFLIDLENLLEILESNKIEKKIVKLSRFPSVSRDITFAAKSDFEYKTLEQALNETLENSKLIFDFSPVSIYQSDSNRETKNISFHLSFASAEKTLNSEDISAIMEKITASAERLGLKIV